MFLNIIIIIILLFLIVKKTNEKFTNYDIPIEAKVLHLPEPVSSDVVYPKWNSLPYV